MKRILFLLLITLSQLPQLAHAQATSSKAYTYMQVFYYGPKTPPGFSFMSFAPSFYNQMEVKLNEPSLATTLFDPSSEGATQSGIAYDPETDSQNPKYIAAAKERQQKEKQAFDKQIKALEERGQKMRETLMKSLNAATTEGWEVVQMSSYGDSGLVYLLRRAK